MNSKKIEIEVPNGKKPEWVNGVLTLVDEKPKNVMERIKTFEDACNELGIDHNEWMQDKKELGLEADVIAYLKLRIIAAALNEGWKPQFTTDEYRYFPWFCLYTQSEIDEMNEEDKSRVVYRSSTMRMRMAVLRMRTRATIHRTRTRALVLGLPSRHANLRNTQVASSLRFGLITFSSRRKRSKITNRGSNSAAP